MDQTAALKRNLKPLTKREEAEMYRLMRRVHRFTATRVEQRRYMALSHTQDAARCVAQQVAA